MDKSKPFRKSEGFFVYNELLIKIKTLLFYEKSVKIQKILLKIRLDNKF